MTASPRANAVFRRRLEEARKRSGLTQTALAKRCAELGEPSYRQTTIAKIENGDRGVGLEDVLVLSAALKVPPGWLVTPAERGAEVEVTPALTAAATAVRAWLGGEPFPGSLDDEDERALFAMMPAEELAVFRWPGVAQMRASVRGLCDATADDDEDRRRDTMLGQLRMIAFNVDRLRAELGED